MESASTITGVVGGLIYLLRLQELRKHSLIATLTHRQRQFLAVKLDDLSAPTALDRPAGWLRQLVLIRKSVFNH
jgi:hypothetical protein